MRIFLLLAMALLTATAAAAQNNPPPPTFPMPPPEPSVMTAPDGRDVPSRVFNDRSTRCMQYGASIGVPAGQMEDYVRRCGLQ
jgi:hypothetical protein